MILLDLLGVVLFCLFIVGALSWFQGRDERAIKRARNSDLKSLTLRYNVATKSLRSIASGSGNPALEAQIALDDIEALHIKELS